MLYVYIFPIFIVGSTDPLSAKQPNVLQPGRSLVLVEQRYSTITAIRCQQEKMAALLGIEPRHLDSESSTLPLCERAIRTNIFKKKYPAIIHIEALYFGQAVYRVCCWRRDRDSNPEGLLNPAA